MRFRQEKKLRILRRPRRSTGDLVFSRGRLSIVLRDKKDQVESRLASVDGELKIYYPSLKRLEVFPASAQEGSAGFGESASVPLFTGDWKGLEKSYRLKLEQLTEKTQKQNEEEPVVRKRLTLIPKEPKSVVTKVEMVFKDLQIEEYLQVEKSGNQVRMEILEWTVNPKIHDERFRFDVPADTKVIHLDGEVTERN